MQQTGPYRATAYKGENVKQNPRSIPGQCPHAIVVPASKPAISSGDMRRVDPETPPHIAWVGVPGTFYIDV